MMGLGTGHARAVHQLLLDSIHVMHERRDGARPPLTNVRDPPP